MHCIILKFCSWFKQNQHGKRQTSRRDKMKVSGLESTLNKYIAYYRLPHIILGGGLKYVLFSPLLGQMIQFE